MKSRILKTFLTIGLAGAVCLTTAKAEALFVSIKSTGMALTQCSYPQDAFVPALNPAGATEVGNRLDNEAGWVREGARANTHGNRGFRTPTLPPRLVTGVNGNRYATRTRDYFPAGFALNQQFFDNKLSLGLLLYNRNQIKTRYKDPNPLFGRTAPGLDYIHEVISANIAYKFWCEHSFGLSVNYNIQRISVKGIESFDHPPFLFLGRIPVPGSSNPGHVTNRHYNYSNGVGVTFGYLWTPREWFRFGISYAPNTSMTRFHKYSGFLADRGKFNIPSKIIAGISFSPIACSTIAFDVEHISWREVRALRNPLRNEFGGINPLGSKGGPGFGWNNQTFYRVGIDYNLSECLTVRAGFRHATEVTRASQTAVNGLLCDVVQDVLTLGTTYAINQCNEISFAYAHGFNKKVKGKGSIPPSFGGGNTDLSRHIDAFGLAWGKVW